MKYLVHCDEENCFMHMTVNTEEEQTHYLANHGCPYWGGESKVSWSVTKTLVQQLWEKLDREVDEIKGNPNAAGVEYHQHRARAIAECIIIFMKPFFETADDIVRESMERWKARQRGDLEYETAGIGHRRYESAAAAHLSATPGWYGTAQDGYTANPDMAGSPSVNRGRGAPVRASAVAAVSDKDKAAMKLAYESMPTVFSPDVLAKQYKVPVAAVKEIVGA